MIKLFHLFAVINFMGLVFIYLQHADKEIRCTLHDPKTDLERDVGYLRQLYGDSAVSKEGIEFYSIDTRGQTVYVDKEKSMGMHMYQWGKGNSSSQNALLKKGSLSTFDYLAYPMCLGAIKKRIHEWVVRNNSTRKEPNSGPHNSSQKDYAELEAMGIMGLADTDMSLCEAMLASYDASGETKSDSLRVSPKRYDYCPNPSTVLFGNISHELRGSTNQTQGEMTPVMEIFGYDKTNFVSTIEPVWDKFTYPARPYSFEHLRFNNICYYNDKFHFVISQHKNDLNVEPEDLLCLSRVRTWGGNSPHWNASELFWKIHENFTAEEVLTHKQVAWIRGTTFFLEQVWSGNNLSFWFRAILHLLIALLDKEKESQISQVLVLNHPSEFEGRVTDWERGLYNAAAFSGGPRLDQVEEVMKINKSTLGSLNTLELQENLGLSFLSEIKGLLWTNSAVCFDSVIVAPLLNRQQILPPEMYHLLRKKAYAVYGVEDIPITQKEKLQVTIIQRKEGRKILNEDELMETVRKHTPNVQIVDFSRMSFQEQLEVSAKTWLLIGAHGAGLMNMIFQPKGSSVLELRPYTNDSRSYFLFAQLFGHTMHRWTASEQNTIKSQKPPRVGYFTDDDFRVNIKYIDSILKKVFSS